MDKAILDELYGKFNLSTRQGQGGMTFKYVPNEDVIDRMNNVFGGNWSTHVMFRDVLDDQVILEVRVSVVDPETEMTHSHTGFGSQQIMRYNSGTNAGKIIDIGNGYKGALAKAIVNACTRWGVGLYKEDTPVSTEMPNLAATAMAPPAMKLPPTATPTPMPAVKPPAVAAPPAVAIPTPPPTPAATPPVAEVTTTFAPPITPEQPVSASVGLTQAMPPIPSAATMPKVPVPEPVVNTTPTTPDLPFSGAASAGEIGISDVQRVALNGILTMNSADYGELALEAFGANSITKAVPNKEDLSYDEAVVVIKFGNDKYRKTR
jgi:hypothetical protein